MTADELREHADMLLSAVPLVPPSHRGSLTAAAAYLRACADAMEKGPVAWRHKPMMGSPSSLSDDGYYISCKRDQGYIIEPLYPLAMPAIPQGWRLVPVAPTPEMLAAADIEHGARGLVSIALIAYRAMLAAAPTPPTPPSPPPECQTEAERRAFCFGWWKAMETRSRADEKPTDAIRAENEGLRDAISDLARMAKNPPTLRLPEPMTSSEISDYARAMVKGDRSVDWLAMQIEAETMRRVKEANNG